MTDEEIAELLEGASNVSTIGGCYVKHIRFGDARDVAEKIRTGMQAIIDKQTIQLAEKDAKIYTYEAIIANSNFKAVLSRAKGGEK